jgi:hypothetical protein
MGLLNIGSLLSTSKMRTFIFVSEYFGSTPWSLNSQRQKSLNKPNIDKLDSSSDTYISTDCQLTGLECFIFNQLSYCQFATCAQWELKITLKYPNDNISIGYTR